MNYKAEIVFDNWCFYLIYGGLFNSNDLILNAEMLLVTADI